MPNSTAGGTLRIMDTLEYGQESVIEYGIDLAFEQFQVALDEHNVIRDEFSMDVVEGTTTEPRHRFGGQARFSMKKVDIEFSQGRKAGSVSTGQTLGLPVYSFAPESLQWTERYFRTCTVAELEAQFKAQLLADVIEDRRQLGLAIFTPTNSTFVDDLHDGTSLSVKALANADSWDYPILPGTGEAPNGATHTHYTAVEVFNDAAATALQTNVREHFEGGVLRIYINVAQETAARALTGFLPIFDGRVQRGQTTAIVSGTALDLWSTYNRQIGIIDGGAEIWVKPWVPSGYVFAYVEGQTKPLLRRADKYDGSDLKVVQLELPDNRRGKLTAYSVERSYGYGVVNRINGACMKITGPSGGTTYTAPSL